MDGSSPAKRRSSMGEGSGHPPRDGMPAQRRASTGNVRWEADTDIAGLSRFNNSSLSASTHHERTRRRMSRSSSASKRNGLLHNSNSSVSSVPLRKSEGSKSSTEEGNNQSAILESTEQRLGDSKKSKRSLLDKVTEIPSQDHWEDPVTVKRPKSVIRRIRLYCGKIVETPWVQLTIIILIIVNALIMGIATFDFVTENPDVENAFNVVDRVFLSIFTIELALQLVYRSLGLFMDGWLVFDFVIVIISWSLESLQIVRAFRIFRALRLITRVGPLRELVMAIGTVMPRISAIGMLLLLIFYIYGVLFTELFGDLVLSDNYFGRLDASLFTCMELMTLEWAGVAREVMEEESWAWLVFLSFISITGFIVFNLVIAVVCDAVSVVDQQVRREQDGEEETDLDRLQRAQERIWELTGVIDEMSERQEEMQRLVRIICSSMQGGSPVPRGILKNGPSSDKRDDGDDSSLVENASSPHHDSMVSSFSVQSYSSFYGESQNSVSFDFTNSNSQSSGRGDEGADSSTTKTRPGKPKNLLADDSSNSASDSNWYPDSRVDAVTRQALAVRGYLDPKKVPANSSGTMQTEPSSNASSIDEKKDQQKSRTKGIPTPSSPSSDGSGRQAPMRSLFSP